MSQAFRFFLGLTWLLSSTATTQAFVTPWTVHPTAVGRGLGASTSSSSSNTPSTIKLVYPDEIQANLEFLARAADTQAEDPDAVYEALSTLERQMRTFAKSDSTVALNLQDQLTGDWRLIFTTGTKQTQERRGGARINYFPIKAIQSFDTTVQPNTIENGIYVGQFPLLQFRGTMEFDLRKCRLEFDFDFLELVGFIGLNLKKGQAASLGSQSGLGSESNVANAAKDKSAFFNWISADQKIATARGGGGGLALWKRVDSSAFD